MNLYPQPLVSVVTPVYNGEKYLEECIASVLAQTYENWEYHIVNNRSTDNSLRIAQSYADKDPRIRVHTNEQFLPIIENFNHSLLHISHQSKYCKIVHADDWLFPPCIAEMVSLAEQHPSVGIVSSYVLRGVRVAYDGLPYPQAIYSGRELARLALLEQSPGGGALYVFGSPTTLLIRSDLIRSRSPFYSQYYYQVIDQEVCYHFLQKVDFGFVYKILSYSRLHSQSATTSNSKIDRVRLEDLMLLMEYGGCYLSKEEYDQRLAKRMQGYYAFLADSLFKMKGKEFWQFHKDGLESLGQFSWPKLINAAFTEAIYRLVSALLNPRQAIRRITGIFITENSSRSESGKVR